MAFGITTAAATSPAIESGRSQRLSNGSRRSVGDVELSALSAVKGLRYPSSSRFELRYSNAPRVAKKNDEATRGAVKNSA
jgi:hypothetical protein